MNTSHPKDTLASLESQRQTQIRTRGWELTAHRFSQDLSALIRSLVHTEVLTRLPQDLAEPRKLVPHLDKMRRLACDAVHLVRQLRKHCRPFQSAKNTVRRGRRHSIPVSRWQADTTKINVRRLESSSRIPGQRFKPKSTVRNRKAKALGPS